MTLLMIIGTMAIVALPITMTALSPAWRLKTKAPSGVASRMPMTSKLMAWRMRSAVVRMEIPGLPGRPER